MAVHWSFREPEDCAICGVVLRHDVTACSTCGEPRATLEADMRRRHTVRVGLTSMLVVELLGVAALVL